MSYVDREVVREVVARASATRPGTAASLSDPQLDAAIERAESKINSRLGRIYSTPFNPVPGLVGDMALAIAAYDLDLTFREVRDYSSDLNPILLRYNDAMKDLEALQNGKATLPDYVPPDPDEPPVDNPRDGGSVVGVYNLDIGLCLPPTHRHGCGCSDDYYGRCL